MPAAHTIDIAGTFPDYTFSFGPPRSRMHPLGHIWFTDEGAHTSMTFRIRTAGFVFCSNNTTDGRLAIFTSANPDPATKIQWDGFGGVFTQPVLSGHVAGQGYTELTFGSANSDSKIYYYKLNLLELATNHIASLDPIIVNK